MTSEGTFPRASCQGAVRRLVEPCALILTLAFALSCAAHSSDSPEVQVATSEPDARDPLAAQPQAEETLECLPQTFEPRPPATPTPRSQPETGACWQAPKSQRKRLRKHVASAWAFEHEGARLQIDFGCDRLGEIAEIMLQGGGGHGGTLDLTRLRRSADGLGWDVLQLRASSGYYPDPDAPPAGAQRGQLSAAQVEDALARARTALTIEAKEIEPDQISGGSFGMSSADFHSFVRLSDTDGRSRELAFVGYMGTDEQQLWIPALAAETALSELIDDTKLDAVAPDADSQRFFMERYLEAEARGFYGDYGWWVRERLIAMAAAQATPDLVPALAKHLCGSDLDASEGRGRAGALSSIFALIGRDQALPLDALEHIDDALAQRWAHGCEVACPS